ncbi:MAG: radical SAM protein, partial [Nanoarchaeota archaeon]|nr:radical SAM protein [Nanoarchaeota archaeon]
LNKNWFYEFFDLYKREIRLPFKCNARIGTINLNMIKLLKEAGIVKLKFGVEHGNEDFRKKILNRHMSNKQIINTSRLCKKQGIECESFIMLGFPYETKKFFFDTVKLCGKIGGRFDVSIFHPYPGTELSRVCQENKWVSNNKNFLERKEAITSYPNFSREEIQFCRDHFYKIIKYNKLIPSKFLLLAYEIFKFSKRFKK